MRIENSSVDTTYINRKTDKTEEGKNPDTAQSSDSSTGTVYAGDLNLNDDIIGDKKLQAQKKALKTLIDQFNNEKSVDGAISDLQEIKSTLSRDRDADSASIDSLEQSKQDLMESYEITKDSPEQKALEQSEEQNMGLYLKSIQRPDKMTKEDTSKLQSAMDSMTDYQKNAFHIDAMEKILQERVSNASDNIFSVNSAIDGIKLEKLKSHPMVDAQVQAEKIVKEASKDIIGTLVQGAKDQVDKTVEENKEKAEKEQEEQDKKNKENKEAGKDVSLSQADQQKLLDNIKQVAEQQKMTIEDIKGIVVDEQV